LPVLSQAEVQGLGAGGRLVVFGDGSQTLTLAGHWTAQPTQTIGGTKFVPYSNGSTSLLVMQSVPVTVNSKLTIPTIGVGSPSGDTDLPPPQANAAALTPLATGTVVFEPVDPSQLLTLVTASSIKITLQDTTSPTPTLVFNEATGMLEEMIPSATGEGVSLMLDGLGEEWVFVGSGTLPPSSSDGDNSCDAGEQRNTWWTDDGHSWDGWDRRPT
jgi:hypothetical protein